jgi:multiple sugar transport system substrate-binding protein
VAPPAPAPAATKPAEPAAQSAAAKPTVEPSLAATPPGALTRPAAPAVPPGGSPAPATAPAAGAATKPAAAPATAPAASSATPAVAPSGSPAPASAPAQAGAGIPLSIAVYEFVDRQWPNKASQEWGQQHPEVDLKIEKMIYAEFDRKQLALLATGSLQDISFAGIRWFPTSAHKGAFLPLDDLVKAKDPGLDDFIPSAVAGSKFDGKLQALPFTVNPGNKNVVMFNKDLLDEKGVRYPTDDWTFEQFAEMAVKLTDKAKRIWGADCAYFDSYYDQACVSRSYGGDILSADSSKFTLTTDPASVKGAQWMHDIINKQQAAPKRADREGLSFPSGRVALLSTGTANFTGIGKAVGDKFKWEIVLGPTGPGGLRGHDGFVTVFAIYAKSKVPEKAYELLTHVTSKDVAMRLALKEEGQATARASVWASDEAQKLSPIYPRAIKWMTDTRHKGPFPFPANLRHTELHDKWNNLAPSIFYGELPLEEGMKKTQEELQKIMDLPRP